MICIFCQQAVPLNHFAHFSFPVSDRHYIAHWDCLENAGCAHMLDLEKSKSVKPKLMKESGHITQLFTFFLIIGILLFVLPVACAYGQEISLKKSIIAQAPVCKTQAAAERVAKRDQAEGVEAAVKQIIADPECGIGSFEFTPMKVVSRWKTARGATVLVVEVLVEMQDGSKQKFYVLTDWTVAGERGA